MIRHYLISFTFFTFIVLSCYSQNLSKDERLRSIIAHNGEVEVKIPFTGRQSLDYLTRNLSLISVRNKNIFISISPLTLEWFIKQKLDYIIIEREDSKGIISASNLSQAMGWDKYPTYTQYDSIMQSFRTLYPDLCHLDTIGTSVNGKLILALKISDNAGINEDEPETFYTSTIHGYETGGYVLMLHLADYLLKNYNLNSRVRNIVDNLQIWINPLANPDGTYNTGNTMTSPGRYNANGYDLNRNFPDKETPYTASHVKQKETIDMINFMRNHKFVISANFHAGAEVVNYPWDKWPRLHADDEWFYKISREYADTVHKHSVAGYMTDEMNGVTNGFQWYSVNGGRQDFVTYELQGREVTIELDKNYYVTPAANLSTLWQSNYLSLMGFLENALNGIHGHVRDATTLDPISSRVFISGHDKDSSHVYSDLYTGSFVRLIAPGIWNLSFRATGFYDLNLSNITVVQGQSTEINADMVPVVNSVETTNPKVPVLYPNPATDKIRCILPESLLGKLNVRIVNSSGVLISDYNAVAVSRIPLIIEVERFVGGLYTVIFTNADTKISTKTRFIVTNN